MDIVTLTDIKENSRIDTDDDDTLLERLGNTAEQLVEQALNRTWGDVTMTYGEIPAPLYHAVLMTVDHLYQHRGATTVMNVITLPYGVPTLIRPYVILGAKKF